MFKVLFIIFLSLLTGCGTVNRSQPQSYLYSISDYPVEIRGKAKTIQSPDKLSTIEKLYADEGVQHIFWLVIYCMFTVIASQYVRVTGKTSPTLNKIMKDIYRRLPFRHKIIYKIIRFFYSRKVRKK